MKIYDEWSTSIRRGFAWWGHRLRQRIWSTSGYDDEGNVIHRVFVVSDLVRDIRLGQSDVDRLLGPMGALALGSARVFDNKGRRYLTFSGSLVSDVICRREKLDKYEVDDLCIWSPRLIDFPNIPKDLELLGRLAEEGLIKAGELTIFRSMLPARLLQRDLIEPWSRNPCYTRVLQRLVSSEPIEIESSKFRALLA